MNYTKKQLPARTAQPPSNSTEYLRNTFGIYIGIPCIHQHIHYDLGVTYRCTPAVHQHRLLAWSDSDFAGDISMRSTTGFVIYTNPASAPITWYSRRQTTTATSTCHAEILAMYACVREIIAVRGIMHDLGALAPGATVLYGDNEGALGLTAEYTASRGSRHFTAQVAWLREQTISGVLRVEHTTTDLMRADSLTKLLGRIMMDRHRNWLLGMDLDSTAALMVLWDAVTLGTNDLALPHPPSTL